MAQKEGVRQRWMENKMELEKKKGWQSLMGKKKQDEWSDDTITLLP